MTIYDYQDCNAAAKAAEIDYLNDATRLFSHGSSLFFDSKEKVWIVRVDDYDKWFRCPNRVPYEQPHP